jgi:hypothetical protein
MKALVATTRYLLHVDLTTKTVTPLEGHRSEYYGISWLPGQQELVLSHSGLDNENLIDIASYAQSETGWISSGRVSSPPFLSQPHQILCASDGRIVCTNTGRNCITIIDPAMSGYFQEARISEARWDRLSLEKVIGDHINSVFESDGKLYAIAHNYSKGSRLAVFAYPSMELISIESINNRSGLHNIWITNEGQKIVCHSEAGAVVDIQSDSVLWEAGSPTYTRGLAASDDIVLIGDSQKTGRDLRRSSLSGLWLICRKTWKALDFFCLGPYGAVNEVRLIDTPDYAHHGHMLNNPEALLESSMDKELSRERLEATTAAKASWHFWHNFDFIFGNPQACTDGGRKAPPEVLCLSILKPKLIANSISFNYVLNESGDSHVSAVIGYRGNGGDTDMMALLLQPNGNTATLSLWIHDGKIWMRQPGTQISQLPLSGKMRTDRRVDSLVTFINDKSVAEISRQETYNFAGALGIRWKGAQVKPCSELPNIQSSINE